jgi:hypothetical protein
VNARSRNARGVSAAWWGAVVLLGASFAAVPRPQESVPPRYHETIEGTLVRFEMRLVPGDRPFYIGVTEVTWDMYDVFALGLDRTADAGKADAIARPSSPYGAPDYGWGHAGFPAISVTRAAAEAFCAWLSLKTGKAYRLPTEAEWMRAAELAAGGSTLPPDRRDALAWHRGNSEARTHAVATKTSDALGRSLPTTLWCSAADRSAIPRRPWGQPRERCRMRRGTKRIRSSRRASGGSRMLRSRDSDWRSRAEHGDRGAHREPGTWGSWRP